MHWHMYIDVVIFMYVVVYTGARMVTYEVTRDSIISNEFNKDGAFPVWCVPYMYRLICLPTLSVSYNFFICCETINRQV